MRQKQQLNPVQGRYGRRFLSIAQKAEQVIDTYGDVYKTDSFTLYSIACQCNAFKREHSNLSTTKIQQQKYQEACIITAGWLKNNEFLNRKITKQNSLACHKLPMALSLLVNTFSRWNENAACRESVMHIAQYISQSRYFLSRFKSQGLANLANAFSKWSAPKDTLFKTACQKIAEHLLRREDLPEFEPQALANLANAFSKWSEPEDTGFKTACQKIAEHLLRREDLPEFEPQALANLANAFSKWSEPEDTGFKTACQKIAKHLPSGDHLRAFKPQELANLANAFSKWSEPKDKKFKTACQHIAEHLLRREDLPKFEPQHLANLANAFSKWSALEAKPKPFKTACQKIAEHLPSGDRLRAFKPQNLANLANAFSKWSEPEDKPFKTACQKIAKHLLRREDLPEFEPQALANLANAFSKWSAPKDEDFKPACQKIAQHLSEGNHLHAFKPQDLANLANAFSKWSEPEDTDFKTACQKIAEHLPSEEDHLRAFKPQHLANLANAFSKWSEPEDTGFKNACQKIANHLPNRNLPEFTPQALANLANAFSKWSALEAKPKPFKTACQEIARQLLSNEQSLPDFTSQQLANLANAFSKWSEPKDTDFKTACQKIANHLPNRDLPEFTPQDLANLANAFSKWSAPEDEDEDFKPACQKIAQQLLDNDNLLPAFNAQNLASLANAFSKWAAPEDTVFKNACQKIAQQLLDNDNLLPAFNAQTLANLANALSKWAAPEDTLFKTACQKLAQQLLDNDNLLPAFNSQDLANLANAFSKWSAPEDTLFKTACQKLAQQLLDNDNLLPAFNSQDLANLANAFSKWSAPEDTLFKTACQEIAEHLPTRNLPEFELQALANLANAFSKWSEPEGKPFKTACRKIAEHLPSMNLQAFKPQDLANLANAFSKWSAPEDTAFKLACQAIAQQLLANGTSLPDFTSQALANLANAFSKWSAPEDTTFKIACQEVAQQLLANETSLLDFTSQHLANLANAFSKWSAPEDTLFKTACQKIAKHLPSRKLPEFDHQALANLANAFSKWSVQRQDMEGYFAEALHTIAKHFIQTPTVVEQSNVLTISMLLKAYRHTGLLNQLAPILIGKLEKQLAAEGNTVLPFKAVNLETLANLAMGLYPLLVQQTEVGLKGRVLSALLKLQPAIARKAHYFLTAASADAAQEAYQSRYPALSHYQLLTVYHQVAQQLLSFNATPHAPSPYADRDSKLSELTAWLTGLLDNHSHAIVDWSSYSWNKIAELEVEYAETETATDQLLDQFAQKHLAKLPPTTFNSDWQRIFEGFTNSPQPPAAGSSGKLTLHQYDAFNKHSVADPVRTITYCLLGRLTNDTLPLLEVKLPGYPSRHLIERLVYRDDIAFRMDLFGGNRMKQKTLTVDERLQQQSKESYGSLVAVPLHETVSGGPLSELLRQLFPYQESFFYVQRALLAQPIAGVQSVLEGCFKLMIFPDQIADTPALFQFKNDLQLRPFDGCGFIKQSLARQMTAVSESESRASSQRDHPADSYLPAQALQHYPAADEALTQEICTQIAPLLTTAQQASNPDELSARRALFFALSSAGMHGKSLVALPASDGNVHWSSTETTVAEPALLIGRAPYNKANLRPIASQRWVKEGTTAQFLRQNNLILQYSLVATSSTDQPPASLWFAKGLSVVIPDEIWPEAYQAYDMVLSAEDIKTDSRWQTEKIRPTTATPLRARGVLVVVDIFPSCDAIAVPPSEQQALSGDFDGDRMLVIAGQPCLFQHIQKHLQHAPPGWAIKPLKTFTPAVNSAGCYQWGRMRQISSVVISNVLQRFTTLQRTWLAVAKDRQQAVAELVVADNQIMQRAKELCPGMPELDSIGCDSRIDLVSNILIQGINAGTDAFKADTAIVQFAALANSLQSLFARQKLPTFLPYSKKNLAEKIAHNRLDPDAIREALQGNPNLAASALRQGLAMWQAQQEAYTITKERDPADRIERAMTRSRG